MMNSIAIIGAGNLGRRHLQSILSLQDIEVFVIDKSEESLSKASEVENPSGHRISYATSYDALPKQLNVVIVATNSLQRKEVVDELLTRCDIQHLVLEKLVFPRLNDYDDTIKKLSGTETKVWINCPFRMYQLFKDIKAAIDSKYPFSITVTGSNWGLATTAIHVLDLMAYFRDDMEMTLVNLLDDHVTESKRKGYYEVSGTIVATNEYGDTVFLNDHQAVKKSPKYFVIESGSNRWCFQDNLTQGMHSNEQTGWTEHSFDFRFPFQSELSSRFVEDLIHSDTCELPEFVKTSRLHHNYLGYLMNHFESINNKAFDICPVT